MNVLQGLLLSTLALANISSTEIYIAEKPQTVPEMIQEIAPQFGQDSDLISRIAYCESKFRDVIHDGGHGKGVTGIHKKTFDYWLIQYEKETGETLHYDSSYDQIKMMAWAFSKGESYREQWTTYVAYKNGGEYTFYSNLLKGTYTAKCYPQVASDKIKEHN